MSNLAVPKNRRQFLTAATAAAGVGGAVLLTERDKLFAQTKAIKPSWPSISPALAAAITAAAQPLQRATAPNAAQIIRWQTVLGIYFGELASSGATTLIQNQLMEPGVLTTQPTYDQLVAVRSRMGFAISDEAFQSLWQGFPANLPQVQQIISTQGVAALHTQYLAALGRLANQLEAQGPVARIPGGRLQEAKVCDYLLAISGTYLFTWSLQLYLGLVLIPGLDVFIIVASGVTMIAAYWC
jgi:hypothetical protein